MQGNFATKSSLIKAQGFLKLCEEGYELLDKKRNVLILSMMSYIDRADDVQNKVARIFDEA